MFRTLHIALGVALALSSASLGTAAENFPLGPLGATAAVESGSNLATLQSVDEGGSAALAGLRTGDQLESIGGQPFAAHDASYDRGGRGPQKAIGDCIDAAFAAAWPAQDETREVRISFGVLREGESLDVEVSLPIRPPLSGPQRAAGRETLRRLAAHQLLASQSDHGGWDSPVGLSGDRVTTAWALTALLAHGDPAHAEACTRAARWLRGPDDRAWLPDDYSKGPDNLGNWALTSSIVALVEHDAATRSSAHRDVVEHMARGLAARMTEEGCFGHDVVVGYGGKGFNVINTLSHFAWAMAETQGISVDAETWNKSLEQIRQSVDPNGGVRYWTMPGTGTADASLRTGSMALALLVRNEEPELRASFVRYLDQHAARTREAHAVGSLGMLVAAAALAHADLAAYERFLEEWRWYLCLQWGADGKVRYIGGKGNNGGDSYLGFSDVAAVITLQLLACEDRRLRMLADR